MSKMKFSRNVDLIAQQNGVLVFSDQALFQIIVEEIETLYNKYEDEVVKELEKKFNYTSLKSEIDLLQEEWLNTENADFKEDPDDKWFDGIGLRTLLNNQGVIKIGESVFVTLEIEKLQVVEITNGDFKLIKDVFNGNYKSKNIVVHTLENSTASRKADDCRQIQVTSGYKNYKNNTRRLKGKVWVYHIPFYSEWGCKSKNFEIKKNGHLKKKKANHIEVLSGGNLYGRQCVLVYSSASMGNSKNNKQKVSDKMHFWGATVITKPNEIASEHYVVDSGANCTLILTLH